MPSFYFYTVPQSLCSTTSILLLTKRPHHYEAIVLVIKQNNTTLLMYDYLLLWHNALHCDTMAYTVMQWPTLWYNGLHCDAMDYTVTQWTTLLLPFLQYLTVTQIHTPLKQWHHHTTFKLWCILLSHLPANVVITVGTFFVTILPCWLL